MSRDRQQVEQTKAWLDLSQVILGQLPDRKPTQENLLKLFDTGIYVPDELKKRMYRLGLIDNPFRFSFSIPYILNSLTAATKLSNEDPTFIYYESPYLGKTFSFDDD